MDQRVSDEEIENIIRFYAPKEADCNARCWETPEGEMIHAHGMFTRDHMWHRWRDRL